MGDVGDTGEDVDEKLWNGNEDEGCDSPEREKVSLASYLYVTIVSFFPQFVVFFCKLLLDNKSRQWQIVFKR